MANYKKNFLKRVILRIDFEDVGLTKIKNYLEKIKPTFEKSERKLGFEAEFRLSFADGKPAPQQIGNEVTLWGLSNEDGTKKAEISSKSFWIEYYAYKDSNELMSDVKAVMNTFIEDFEVKVVNRVGLRYLNLIVPPDGAKPTQWGKYINPKLLAGIDFADEQSIALSRYTGQLIRHTDTFDLQFNYGILNPDYPNEIARKEFALDLDCYANLPMDTHDFVLSDVVKEFNIEIEKLFEASILEPLRVIMRKG